MHAQFRSKVHNAAVRGQYFDAGVTKKLLVIMLLCDAATIDEVLPF